MNESHPCKGEKYDELVFIVKRHVDNRPEAELGMTPDKQGLIFCGCNLSCTYK